MCITTVRSAMLSRFGGKCRDRGHFYGADIIKRRQFIERLDSIVEKLSGSGPTVPCVEKESAHHEVNLNDGFLGGFS
jgi:hypothetical protein